jgi:hypothetical protein
MDAGQVQEGENGGRRIHRLSHYYPRIYYYTFCPYAGNIFALKTVDIEIK